MNSFESTDDDRCRTDALRALSPAADASGSGNPGDSLATTRPIWRPRLAFGVVVIIAGLITAGTSVLTPLLSMFEEELNVTSAQVVLLFASYTLGIIVALLWTAVFRSRIAVQDRLIIAVVLAIVAAVSFASTTSFILLLVARVTSGLAFGAVTSTAVSALVALDGEGNRQRSAVTAVAANFTGLAVGAIFGGLISSIDGGSRQLPFLVLAIVTSFLLPVLIGVRGEIGRAVRHEPTSARGGLSRALGHLDARSRPVFMRSVILSGIAFPANALASVSASYYFASELGISGRTAAGIAVGLGFLATAAGQMIVRRLTARANQITARVVLSVGVTALFLSLLFPSWALFLSGSVITGVGTGVATGSGLSSITVLPDRLELAGLTNRYYVILYLGLFFPITALGLLEMSVGVAAGTAVACLVCLAALLASIFGLPSSRRTCSTDAGS